MKSSMKFKTHPNPMKKIYERSTWLKNFMLSETNYKSQKS